MASERCRTCNKPIPPDRKHFPFCSDRCRMVDLGRWFEGSYRVPLSGAGPEDEPDPDAPGEDEPGRDDPRTPS